MINSYSVKCNLIEIQYCKEKVIKTVRMARCVGYSGEGDTITFHFPARGGAMMVFLELEDFLDNLSIETSPSFIDKNNLKGVFKYD
jgi:hypothetical protein